MSARNVCNGTRPSRYHSMRAISAPPRRPEQLMRMPSAPRRMADCTARLLVRTLDDNLRHRRLLQLLHQRVADRHVLVHEPRVLALAGEPARVPGPVDAQTQADRVDLLTHQLLLTPAVRRRLRAPRW